MFLSNWIDGGLRCTTSKDLFRDVQRGHVVRTRTTPLRLILPRTVVSGRPLVWPCFKISGDTAIFCMRGVDMSLEFDVVDVLASSEA